MPASLHDLKMPVSKNFRTGQLFLLLLCLIVAVPWHSSIGADETEIEGGDASAAADAPVGASDEGELAMQSFRKPDGWTVALFAAEPELANPVAMYVDHRGRVFVCESFRQGRGVTDNRQHDREWLIADLSAQSVQDRIDYHRRLLGSEAAEYTAHDDRIRLLEDTDGDGVADKATMFAEGFNNLEDGTGAGVLVRGQQAYYTCIPKLWSLTDEDGDGQAEKRVALHDGYGVRVAFRGHDSHGLIIGPDGRLYFSIGDRGYHLQTPEGTLKDVESGAVFRCELDGSNLEVFATGLRNPQELAFDDYGYLFTGDNNSDSGDKARWVNVMEGGDSGWRMMYQYLPDRGPFNREKLWHPYSQETPGYIVPPIENIGDGPSGLTCYPGTGLTGDYANCFFMADFRGGASNSGIRLIRTQPKGAFWELERSEQPLWNILATDVDFGPDGALWVCDWVNGWVGEGKGRVYRFQDPSAREQEVVREVQSLLAEGFTKLSTSRLAELLRHADRRIRLEAQWELATRHEVAPLAAMLGDAGAGTIARLHGAWGLGHAARLEPSLRDSVTPALTAALSDHDLDVRAAAANVVGDLQLAACRGAIVELIGDSEPRVQYAACLAAGKLELATATDAVCKVLAENADRDPGLRHAGIMALKGILGSSQDFAVAQHASPSVRLAVVVALRKLADVRVAELLDDPNAGVQLEAARAIHDVPALHRVLDRLAQLSLPDDPADALVHRVLNANFRLGGVQAAQAIADFAAAAEHRDAMRKEAIEMLGSWAAPGELDRVMNRYAPLDERDSAVAVEVFERRFDQLLNGASDVQLAALNAAVDLQVTGAAPVLRRFADDRNNSAPTRRQAIRGLVRLQGDEATNAMQALVEDADATVRAEALAQLASLKPLLALPGLRQATRSKSTAECQQAWDTLAQIELPDAKQLIGEGLEKYLAGSLPPDTWLNVLEAAEGRVSREMQEKLAAFQEQTSDDPLEAYRECIFGGDVDAGRELFFTKTELSCVRCHKVADTGGEVGPDLSEIGKTKDNRYLLESIVHPDAKIAENFETVLLLTEDDEIITGILRSETPSKIELMNAEGAVVVVDPVEVVSRRKGKSAMPTELLKSITRRELRDLVAYLSSLKGEG